jgi:uncharacterized membrane protein
VPNLTVWIYDTPLGAEAGHRRLRRLLANEALHLLDAVTVSWVPGAHEPRLLHTRGTTAFNADGSVLAALIRLWPAASLRPDGGAVEGGPAPEEVAEGLRCAGIEPAFLEEVSTRMAPGTSALWVLSGEVDFDQVRPVVEQAVARGDVILRHVRLPQDGPDALADALGVGRGHHD